MKFYLRHWYSVGLVMALCLAIYLAISWAELEVLSRLLIMSYIALLIHQFEEYGFPGGEPAIMNMVIQPSDIPDHFPLNQLSAMVTNVVIAYPFYVLPIIFPNVVWLALAPLFMGMGQILVHGVQTNVKMKSFYNPGLGAVILLHWPIGIYYIWYVVTNQLVIASDWIISVVYVILFMVFGVAFMTYVVMADRNTTYSFAKEEMERFRVEEKINKKGILIDLNAEKTGPFKLIEKIQSKRN